MKNTQHTRRTRGRDTKAAAQRRARTPAAVHEHRAAAGQERPPTMGLIRPRVLAATDQRQHNRGPVRRAYSPCGRMGAIRLPGGAIARLQVFTIHTWSDWLKGTCRSQKRHGNDVLIRRPANHFALPGAGTQLTYVLPPPGNEATTWKYTVVPVEKNRSLTAQASCGN